MITKEILVYLFQKKDPSRKRNLYKLYSSIIDSDASRDFIVKMINDDLGKADLVTLADIKYCRNEFRKKKKVEMSSNFNKPKLIEQPKEEKIVKTKLDFDIELTDPDEISANRNILKSKHSYK